MAKTFYVWSGKTAILDVTELFDLSFSNYIFHQKRRFIEFLVTGETERARADFWRGTGTGRGWHRQHQCARSPAAHRFTQKSSQISRVKRSLVWLVAARTRASRLLAEKTSRHDGVQGTVGDALLLQRPLTRGQPGARHRAHGLLASPPVTMWLYLSPSFSVSKKPYFCLPQLSNSCIH